MSRAAAGETIVVAPKTNVYTVLVISAVVVELIGILAIAGRFHTLFPDKGYLFF